MAARRRVALVVSADGWRGSHLSYSGIARGLARRGHDVVLLTGAPDSAARFDEQGIRTVRLDLSFTGLRQARGLRAALVARGTEVVITDSPHDLRLAALALLATDMRLVHRYNLTLRPDAPRDLRTRLALRRASGTIFLTEADARRVIASAAHFGRRPYWIIGSPVDLETFHPDAEAAGRFRRAHGLGDAPFVLAAAALHEHKRHKVLIDAIALLGAGAPPLVICGEGPQRNILAARAASKGVDLRLPGFLSHDEMRGGYSAATVVAHASPLETFGRTVAEAMACGAAVVAVGAGSVVDVVGDAGRLVAGPDPEAFAGEIAGLLRDLSLRAELGTAAPARIRARFSLAATLDGYDALLADPRLGTTPR